MSTIATGDVSHSFSDEGVNDAAEALLARFMPEGDPDAQNEPSAEGKPKTPEKRSPAPKPAEEPTEPDDDEVPAPEGDEADEVEEKPEEKKYVDDDEARVKVKVDDEEREVPVKDLKRLYGQEAALTRKSQEVAELRKKADAELVKSATALTTLLQRAKEKLDPYNGVDYDAAARALSPEDMKALRAEQQARAADVQFLEQELSGVVKAAATKQQETIVEQAKACTAALKDDASPHHIPDWGDAVYGQLRDFAVKQGLNVDVFNQITDPAAIKLVHMAQQYQNGISKVKTVTVNKTAKKIVKTSTSPQIGKASKSDQDKAMSRLKRTGSQDAAAEAFLARWSDSSDD
jgi:hypothetical protein